jgi:hypothetical protein
VRRQIDMTQKVGLGLNSSSQKMHAPRDALVRKLSVKIPSPSCLLTAQTWRWQPPS